ARKFFVEENVLHRLDAIRIEADRELADVTRTFVGVEHFVEALGIGAGGIHHFAVLENKTDIVVRDAAVDGRRVEVNDAVHAGADGRGEAFAIRDIRAAFTLFGGDALD